MRSNRKVVLKALMKPNNWNPDLTKISNDTGIPVSTVFDQIKRIKQDGIFKLNCVFRQKRKKND